MSLELRSKEPTLDWGTSLVPSARVSRTPTGSTISEDVSLIVLEGDVCFRFR